MQVEIIGLDFNSRRLRIMVEALSKSQKSVPIPRSYWRGQELDWQATTVPVKLRVELPYWLMVPNCAQDVKVNGRKFWVEIRDDYVELYANAIVDSKSTCVYIGPPQRLRPDSQKAIDERKVAVLTRKCKTVLRIHSDCNKDALAAFKEKRTNAAYQYLKSFCIAHLEVINRLIQQYRLSAYDYFAHELSPWDAPIWFVCSDEGFVRIVLQEYAAFDEKPVIVSNSGAGEKCKLIEPSELQTALTVQPSAGEFELLDALNFMERGDYSGAVRRITTAIEVQTEFVLRQELLKTYSSEDAEKKFKALENKFWAMLGLYEELSGRKMIEFFRKDLDRTRKLRHSIVHGGKRITLAERGQAQNSVDVGRWIFDWLENEPTKKAIRENIRNIAKRSFGQYSRLYSTEITPAGVIVHKLQI